MPDNRFMRVTVLTTVPSSNAPATDVQATVARLIDEFADAGLVVTGPDIRSTHPLARLVTRAACVYELYRDDHYTPLQLSEFVHLASLGPTVVQVGNGPVRSVDGENLQAPGNDVKVPVAEDAVRRRLSSLSAMRGLGHDVPPVLGRAEARLRALPELEAMMRAQALVGQVAALVMAGRAPESDDLVSVGRGLMGTRERDFLREVGRRVAAGGFEVSDGLYREAQVHLTAVAAAEALGWVLGRVLVDDARVIPARMDPEAWVMGAPGGGSGELRGMEEILDAFDLAHVVHHAEPEWMAREGRRIARGWNRALGWALWPGSQWGQSERVI